MQRSKLRKRKRRGNVMWKLDIKFRLFSLISIHNFQFIKFPICNFEELKKKKKEFSLLLLLMLRQNTLILPTEFFPIGISKSFLDYLFWVLPPHPSSKLHRDQSWLKNSLKPLIWISMIKTMKLFMECSYGSIFYKSML